MKTAVDRVSEEVMRWTLRKMCVNEWLIRTVMVLYIQACTVVRSAAGLIESFEVKVGLRHGTVMSPLLISVVIDFASSEAISGLLSELKYDEYSNLIAQTTEELHKELKVNAGESRGL